VANWSRGRFSWPAGEDKCRHAVMGLSPAARTLRSADTALLIEPVPPATPSAFPAGWSGWTSAC